MVRKQHISNKSFGKLLKMFRKHVIKYMILEFEYREERPKFGLIGFEKVLDDYVYKLHNTYKRKPFYGISKYTFKTDVGEMRIGFQFDKKFENINFKMLVRKPGKMKFERKRQINIRIKCSFVFL